MNFQNRLTSTFQDENRRRKEAGEPRLKKTDLWQAAKLTSASATHWFNGDNAADLDTCLKIAPLLRVNGQWLFDGTAPKFPAAQNSTAHEDHSAIKLVDAKASAGRGSIILSADASKDLMFRKDWLQKHGAKAQDVIGLEVDGDSMVDLHIIHGAVVLANRNKREPVNRKLFIVWCDGELYVKQLVKSGDRWLARSHNKEKAEKYPDMPLKDMDRIEGRVFWCGFEL